MAQAYIRRRGRRVPEYPHYTFTGSHQLLDDGDGNWRIKLKSSGTLTFQYERLIDVFLVGAGGGATAVNGTSTGEYRYASGGGGGYAQTCASLTAQRKTDYSVIVGVGAAGAEGAASSAFGQSAAGGKAGGLASTGYVAGGDGGSGGGGYLGAGGSDGANGGSGYNSCPGGSGQGTTTREFGEADGAPYAAGGNGGQPDTDGAAGAANTGDGATPYKSNSADSHDGFAGGSGIVIVRNHR